MIKIYIFVFLKKQPNYDITFNGAGSGLADMENLNKFVDLVS